MNSEDSDDLLKQNQELNEQVKQLFKTEKRLYAIQNELDRQVVRINFLNQFILEASRIRDPSLILEKAMEMICSIFHLSEGVAAAPDGDNRLTVKFSKGLSKEHIVGLFLPPWTADTKSGRYNFQGPYVSEKTSQILKDSEFDRYLEELDQRVAGRQKGEKFNFKNGINLALPLYSKEGNLISLILAGDDRIGDMPFHVAPPNQKDLPFLQLIKAHIEVLLENAMLANALGQSAAEMEKKVEERTRELKETQGRLIQSGKMSAVGQLAAGVAHEINNPLGVILGFAQSVLKQLSGPTDRFFFPISSIEREAKRCRDLVQELLTFSRAEKPQMTSCDLNEIVQATRSVILAQAKIKSVEIFLKLQEDIPKTLMNKNQIQQVIFNLCSNSMDAMPGGGKLTILTQVPNSSSPQDFIEMSISDTGTGIPENIKGNIFEPFFTTKEVGKGTGLGLSLVYEIVQKHHGTIEVVSKIGEGTTFNLKFPITTAK